MVLWADNSLEDLDAHDDPIMEASGQYTERICIVDGAINGIQEAVMSPKMRPLTSREMAELKEQQDRNPGVLGAMAVKEV